MKTSATSAKLNSDFVEPLRAVAEITPSEQAAWSKALADYSADTRTKEAKCDLLETFLKEHPQSPWAPSIRLNLGLMYHKIGRFTRAIPTLKQAWEATKDLKDPQGKALADHALGEYAITLAHLGRLEDLEPLMEQVKSRSVQGPGTELLAAAREGLFMMHKRPEISFLCGPAALGRICQSKKLWNDETRKLVLAAESTQKGTTIAQVASLSKKIGLNYQVAFRSPGAEVVTPAVAHWKVGHFAALLDPKDGFYPVEDDTAGFSREKVRIERNTLDEESSGYFLVKEGQLPVGWRKVNSDEAAEIWGRGNTGLSRDPNSTGTKDSSVKGGSVEECPMTEWDVNTMLVSLALVDTPVGRSPGAFAVPFTVRYSQRDAGQPAVFDFTNFGPKWTCNWISHITDERGTNNRARLYKAGGGIDDYTFSSSSTVSQQGAYTQAVLSDTGTGWTLTWPDGSKQLYNKQIGARYHLTALIDPQGNTTAVEYDSQDRISVVRDAVGRPMTFNYELTSDPLKVTSVKDPFGRSSTLQYTTDGHLASVTDILGITSSYEYDDNDFVNSLKTPYGTTSFSYGDISTDPNLGATRYIEIVDPAGRKSRIESTQGAPVPSSEPQTPDGMLTNNQFLDFRNTFYWEPQQLDTTPDYSKATIYHFLHLGNLNSTSTTSRVLESLKRPLQNRIWYDYNSQLGGFFQDSERNLPTAVGRILSDGSSQVFRYAYNAQGNLTQVRVPREIQATNYDYNYAPNGIDLTSVTYAGTNTVFSTSYDNNHNITSFTDASGQTSSFTYDARGLMLTATNPLSETTTYSYSASGNLVSIQEPLSKITTFGYDSAERLSSATDSEGYTIQANYDQADRPISVTYPDGTTDTITYSLLDRAATKDRLGRKTSMSHDGLRRLTSITDPKGGIVGLGYGLEDSPISLTDQGGKQTAFAYDLQQRLITKTYANGSTQQTSYESCSGRVNSITDALGHAKTFSYNLDNTIRDITYNSGNTPNVHIEYDFYLPRPTEISNSNFWHESYSYVPLGSPGAGQVDTIGRSLGASSSFQYDLAGRMTSRTVEGETESMIYDALWRTTTTSNPLDTFNYSYLGKTNQVTAVTSNEGPNLQFTYSPNVNDRRLAQIKNLGKTNAQVLSQFDFSYDPVGQITKLVESHGSASTGGSGHDCRKKCCHDKKKCCKEACCKKKCCEGKGKCGKNPCTSHRDDGKDDDDDDDRRRHHSLVFPFSSGLSQTLAALIALSACGFAMAKMARQTVNAQPVFARITCLALMSTIFLNGCLGTAPVTNLASTTQDFSYDDLGQLIGISVNSTPSASFQFDPSGNLQSFTTGTTTTSFSYNDLNQPIAPAGAIYDDKGQLTVQGTRTFDWDDEGRVTGIHDGQIGTLIQYDPYGRRYCMAEFGANNSLAKKIYIWIGNEIVCERDGFAGTILKRYFKQGVVDGTTKLYYTFDQLGSIRELVDSTGAIRAQYSYDSYGTRTKTSGDLDSDFGYAGLFHHSSGLDFAVHRVYDSTQHRWLSRDPLGEGVDLNLYRYCGNSPTNFSDPDGLKPQPFTPIYFPIMDVNTGSLFASCTVTGTYDPDTGHVESEVELQNSSPDRLYINVEVRLDAHPASIHAQTSAPVKGTINAGTVVGDGSMTLHRSTTIDTNTVNDFSVLTTFSTLHIVDLNPRVRVAPDKWFEYRTTIIDNTDFKWDK